MDTSQYMTMFIEESMDNLQTLNESLLDLEQDPSDVDKLNEIFRVAHTMKGMAATMGFSDIASEFRDGELSVTQEVVTVLFDCLDTLEKMITNVEDGVEEQVDINPIMEALNKVAHSGNGEETQTKEVIKGASDGKEVKEVSDGKNLVALNEYDYSVIKQAMEKGYNAIEIKITLSENTLLKSARAFLIVKDLEEAGEIIKSVPETQEIENEEFDLELSFVIVTNNSEEEIKSLVEGISEVRKVEVETVVIENEAEKQEEVQPKNIVDSPKQEKKPAKKAKTKKESTKPKKAHQSVRVDLERINEYGF